MPIAASSPDRPSYTAMNQDHSKRLAEQEITVPIAAAFSIWFVADQGRGRYRVGCRGLPEVVGYGKTVSAARRDVIRKIRRGA